jgi:hypothetical protein
MELAECVEEIESRHAGRNRATLEGLAAIDDADHSGVASEEQVAAAFHAFRRA